jgi:phospho-N-acetylmuramoyl-pentapeptide-transferase
MLYILVTNFKDWLEANGMYSVLQIFEQLHFRAIAAALFSFLVVLALGRRTIAWLTRMKIGDSGLSDADALRLHSSSKANVPMMGGILIVGAIIGACVILGDVRSFYLQLGLVVLLWLAVLGGFDDWLKLTAKLRGTGSRQGLYAWEKLVFQIGLGLLVGYFLYKQGTGESDLRHVLTLPFQKTYVRAGAEQNPALIYLGRGAFILLALAMVAGMSNAVNITDGMDGLACGISGTVSVGLVILALIAGERLTAQSLLVPHIEGSRELAILAGATTGACLGFLWWNCSPAQVFMGDTGALALGGVIGYIAVAIRQEFLVLVMSGVFLWEIATVAMQVTYFKLTKGKRIFRVAPYHHHLHLGGWTEQQVVARAWIVSVLLVAVALLLVKMR